MLHPQFDLQHYISRYPVPESVENWMDYLSRVGAQPAIAASIEQIRERDREDNQDDQKLPCQVML